jgi:hypothetical protein
MKAKHQRLALIGFALVALILAGLLAAWALRNQANYFYLPEQMQADPPAVGQAVRLGGMVQQGSVKTLADGVTIAFTVTGTGGAGAGALRRDRARACSKRDRAWWPKASATGRRHFPRRQSARQA